MRTFLLLLLVSLGAGCAVSLLLWPIFRVLSIFEAPQRRKQISISKSIALPAAAACVTGSRNAPVFPDALASQVATRLICSALLQGIPRVRAIYVQQELGRIGSAASSAASKIMSIHAHAH